MTCSLTQPLPSLQPLEVVVNKSSYVSWPSLTSIMFFITHLVNRYVHIMLLPRSEFEDRQRFKKIISLNLFVLFKCLHFAKFWFCRLLYADRAGILYLRMGHIYVWGSLASTFSWRHSRQKHPWHHISDHQDLSSLKKTHQEEVVIQSPSSR